MTGDEHLFNSRLFRRDEVRIAGEVRERGGGKQRISVIDLSQSGFRMHCVFLIPNDRTIFLTMPGLEAMEARIAWHESDYYGCEFKRKLYPAVYEHIIKEIRIAVPDISAGPTDFLPAQATLCTKTQPAE